MGSRVCYRLLRNSSIANAVGGHPGTLSPKPFVHVPTPTRAKSMIVLKSCPTQIFRLNLLPS